MIPLIRFFLGFTLVLTSLFLILLVLIQRGRGGGLTGALGGMGGQSAFGTKAGDIFTKITVGVAAFWIGLCILSINVLGRQQSLFSSSLGTAAPQAVAPQTQPTPPSGGVPQAPDSAAPAPEAKPAEPAASTEPASADQKSEAASDAKPAAEPAVAAPAATPEPAAK
ncbi:MAG: preprotein translocase subunit SecG [Pirellulales bacterium]